MPGAGWTSDPLPSASPGAARRRLLRHERGRVPPVAAAARRSRPGCRRHRRPARADRGVARDARPQPVARRAVRRLDRRHPHRRLRHVGVERRVGHRRAGAEARGERAARDRVDRAVDPGRGTARHRRRCPSPQGRWARVVGGQPTRHRAADVLGRPDARHPVRRPLADPPGPGVPARRVERPRSGDPVARAADDHARPGAGRGADAVRALGHPRRVCTRSTSAPRGPRVSRGPRRCSATGCATRRCRSCRSSACRSPA